MAGELHWLTSRVGYLPGPVNRGVVRLDGQRAIVIDTGLDRDAARRLISALRGADLQPTIVLNTHAHADHIGGNAQVVRAVGAKVYAPIGEAPFLLQPILESAALYGGAYPPAALRPRFLLAEPSPVHKLIDQDSTLPGDVRLVPLPGHTLDHVGYLADGVAFCGDAYLGRAILEKHAIPFAMRIEQLLASLDVMAGLSASWYIPAHGDPQQDPAADWAANRTRIEEIRDLILTAIHEPLDVATLTAGVAASLDRPLETPVQIMLAETMVRAVLSWLNEQGQAECTVKDGRLVWRQG